MKILVTGGAGYIGSFMVKRLLDQDDQVTVIDSLERGHLEAVDRRADFIKLDIRDLKSLTDFFSGKHFDGLIHFAGYISVEESSKYPKKYYENNVEGSKNVFSIAVGSGVNKIIFSSTAAVYGNPIKIPIPEDHPKNPTSPYGETKLATEETLKALREKNANLSFAALRYFNAAGAALDGSNGENHDPETHIIPLAMRALLTGSEFSLYGTDYDTPDRTCIRDYIHVLDLVEAHIKAFNRIEKDRGCYYYNIGTGQGHSNRQVLDMVEKVTGRKLKIREEERRAGDPDRLVADPSKIKSELGFSPKYSNLEAIVKSAWTWHTRNLKF
ncbi:MAG: UDP-glucose 4-epimerase GalE [Candidatus Levybacteria bacterium RIFCSPHIGHO2_02_FULL_39_36]|nr:MAG: UDP-glucose 4-epimerase [Candidatus Levybacteria bacterium GW2011_GWA1_39_11]KKR26018.1 MAG: UDP-glucose 4-epimerase [Microgenomates group bacterium GW2011_GWC1_39_7]OGD89306.1 MAG: UDP-glucose 4-epimerase GalE [Candidatus Curtissbacteria bacterium RIFCSPHIGHO2_02_39_8]OGH15420.1 MAG: UDP-glucose 4-epimerase GalE [Candidatus Levybacteria bacterium RIFCSPHIGHO2_01_FULL_38_96]OGH27452.1 MAG: UDP-glucose 4-epimerase GalE [Candidatus Levybacteria bacterium RIFCSPHIGHO2_02_FULL_39_36]OGH362